MRSIFVPIPLNDSLQLPMSFLLPAFLPDIYHDSYPEHREALHICS